jgi:trehalose-6-phosphate synthase
MTCLILDNLISAADVPEYQKLKRTVDELVGSINSRFGGLGFNPIHYLFKSGMTLSRELPYSTDMLFCH